MMPFGMTAKEALRWVKRGFVIEWTGEEFVVVNFLLNPTRVKQRGIRNAPISSKRASLRSSPQQKGRPEVFERRYG
jgi:hypothetical protein